MARTNTPKFEVGQKVRLKESRDGTFKDFKGSILTVSGIYRQEASTDDVTLKIKEIGEVEKYHGIYQQHFEEA